MRLCPPTKYRLCPRGQFFRLFLTLQFGHFIGQFLAMRAFRICLPVPRLVMVGQGFVGIATAIADKFAQLMAIVVEVNYLCRHWTVVNPNNSCARTYWLKNCPNISPYTPGSSRQRGSYWQVPSGCLRACSIPSAICVAIHSAKNL